MAKTVTNAYSEILRLRNEFYQKWQEADQYDENRSAYKAKYEAFDKALELLTPSIVDPQPEEPVNEELEKEIHNEVTKLHTAPCYDELANFARHFIHWQKQKVINDTKLHGWVARDENGSLHLFEVEPSRIMHRWWDRDYHSTTLDNKDFPDLKWEDEPVYVKLPIIVED